MNIDDLTYDSSGLVPAVVQSRESKRVLMVAWMSRESLAETIRTGETVFYSRSRQQLWHKGSTSGNVQKVIKIEVDCDSDTLLVLVDEAGPACHNGTESCFDSAYLELAV